MKDEDFEKVLMEFHRTKTVAVVFLPDHQYNQLSNCPNCPSVKIGSTHYMREREIK